MFCFNCLGFSFKSCVSKIILGLKASYLVNVMMAQYSLESVNLTAGFSLGHLLAGDKGQVMRCLPRGIVQIIPITCTLYYINTVNTRHPEKLSDSHTDPSTGSGRLR